MSYLGIVNPNANINEQYFTATAGQTTFTTKYVLGQVDVFKNGLRLIDGVDFTATNGTTVVLTSPAAANDKIDVVDMSLVQLDNVYSDVSLSQKFIPVVNSLSDTYKEFASIRGKNFFINPGPSVWTRGSMDGTVTTTFTGSGFTAPQWYFGQTAAGTGTLTRQLFTTGQTDVPENPPYYFQLAHTPPGSPATNYVSYIRQRIENVWLFSNQTVTLSFWAKATSSGKKLAVDLTQNFGSGGTPSAQVTYGTQKFNLTTTWQRFTKTVHLPPIGAKTLGTGGDDGLIVYFWVSGGTDYDVRTDYIGMQTGTFHLANFQLEYGETATSFEFRQTTVEEELCRRYYESSPNAATNLVSSDTTAGATYYRQFRFLTQKQNPPTVTLSNISQNRFPTSVGTVGGVSTAGFYEYRVATSTGANGYFYSDWEASAEI